MRTLHFSSWAFGSVLLVAAAAAAVACGSTVDADSGPDSGSGPRSGDGDPDGGGDAAAEGAARKPDASDGDVPSEASAARSIAVANGRSCAIKKDGSVKCWGTTSLILGTLGLGDTLDRGGQPGEMGAALPAVNLGTGKKAIAIAANENHTCAILEGGSLKCWGWNTYGQLGLGDKVSRGSQPTDMGDNLHAVDLGTGRTAKAVAAGEFHTCAILDDDSVKCWGDNTHGALGLGDTDPRAQVAGQMGDALPTVDLGTGRTARAIAAGTYRTCALLDDASVKCWGWNGAGSLGLGDTNDRGAQPGQMGDALPAVNLGTGRTAIAIGTTLDMTCAILDDGSVKCWGAVIGLGGSQYWGTSPSQMGDALPAIALGTGRKAKALSIGTDAVASACVILDDGASKCWGWNDHGQLGLGDIATRGNGDGQMGDALPEIDLGAGRKVRELATGYGHACALLDDDHLVCWGKNDVGQLGLGDKNDRGDAPGQMGATLPNVDLGP